MSNILDFTIARLRRGTVPRNPRGEVSIFPCCNDGGSWGVEHISRNGDSAVFIGSFFSLDQATAAARRAAAETGADFVPVGGTVR